MRVPGNDLGMAYFDLQDDLERLFGRPVDLVAKDGLHRVIRDQVLSDAQVLYAASGTEDRAVANRLAEHLRIEGNI